MQDSMTRMGRKGAAAAGESDGSPKPAGYQVCGGPRGNAKKKNRKKIHQIISKAGRVHVILRGKKEATRNRSKVEEGKESTWRPIARRGCERASWKKSEKCIQHDS